MRFGRLLGHFLLDTSAAAVAAAAAAVAAAVLGSSGRLKVLADLPVSKGLVPRPRAQGPSELERLHSRPFS